jgi:hypothetical protein
MSPECTDGRSVEEFSHLLASFNLIFEVYSTQCLQVQLRTVRRSTKVACGAFDIPEAAMRSIRRQRRLNRLIRCFPSSIVSGALRNMFLKTYVFLVLWA